MPTPRLAPIPVLTPAELSYSTCPPVDSQFPTAMADYDCERPAEAICDADEVKLESIEDRQVFNVLTRGHAPLDKPLDAPSPVGTDGSSTESEQRLSRSIATPEPARIHNIYPLGNPFPLTRHLPNTTSSFLRPGSRFSGTQRSEKQQYEVQVELQHVDVENSYLCGYLRIQGLTDDHPTLTTFFDGEMIGSKHSFITKHPDWGANEKVDMQHWERFPAWRPLASQAKRQNFSLKNFAQRENIFMRWKEDFLVPDHRVRNITGASFEGFYYICFNQASGSITGIYFHARSEK
jgi:glucose-induced degradation protein 4